MTKELLKLAAVVALVVIFAFAAIPRVEEPKAESAKRCEPMVEPVEVPKYRYEVTENERKLICEVVMAEAGTEPYDGKIAVSQCILNACEIENKRPAEIIAEYGYTKKRINPNAETVKAVSAVFDKGETVTDAKILYFYAPALCTSSWHESQTYVCTIGGHRFFEEAEK